MLLTALSACTPDVRGLYEEERTAALQVATELPAGWEPDLTLTVAGPDFGDAVSSAIKTALSRKQEAITVPVLGMDAKLRPVFSVEDATLHGSDACPSCVAFDADLVGKAAWSLGPASGTIPLDVSAKGVFSLEVRDGHIVEAVPRTVSSVRVRVTDMGALRVNPSKEIQAWLTGELSERIPRIRVVDLDTATLPLRDIRLRSQGTAVRIEALTNVPGAKPVGAVDPPVAGVRLAMSETALVGLARRAAFAQGELTMEVYADPLELNVQDDAFTLDLRLWRLVGRGWWRDYRVYGTVAVKGGRIALDPARTEELGHSSGAGLVDPLAVLFQGKILAAITDALEQSLPATQKQDLGIIQLKAVPQSVTGRADALVLDGKLHVKSPEAGGR